MKEYRSVPIFECHEPLVPIPRTAFALCSPHPYVMQGAPYEGLSPWHVRHSVLEALLQAQDSLRQRHPGWRLRLFDAYRPNIAQSFLVWQECLRQAQTLDMNIAAHGSYEAFHATDPAGCRILEPLVFRFWGVPSSDPRTPPPHSTGAAVDVTLEYAHGREADMGCPIDEMSARAAPDFFAHAADGAGRQAHRLRRLLNEVMTESGFVRHPAEWWHFSLGDQFHAWLAGLPHAVYGRADLVKAVPIPRR